MRSTELNFSPGWCGQTDPHCKFFLEPTDMSRVPYLKRSNAFLNAWTQFIDH